MTFTGNFIGYCCILNCNMCAHFRMERDKGFNFKLLVPPRVNTGQVSAVRPQEITENCGDFMNVLQQVS